MCEYQDGKILAVLGADARGRTVRSAEHDLDAHLSARHVARLGGRIDQMVHRLHGEIEGHEFDHRLEAGERGPDAEPGKAVLGDRRIDDAAGAEFLQQALGDLVGALIFGDLFAHHEHVAVAPHLLRHGVAQRFAHRHRDHLGAGRNVGLRQLRSWLAGRWVPTRRPAPWRRAFVPGAARAAQVRHLRFRLPPGWWRSGC